MVLDPLFKMNTKVCKCNHHSVVPLLIVGLAILFLLPRFGVITDEITGFVWPILLGIIGLTKLTERNCGCC